MSKSRGNVVRPGPIADVMGADALRYFLLREITFGQDGSFSYDALIQRYNADLANGLGNLASRTLTHDPAVSRRRGSGIPMGRGRDRRSPRATMCSDRAGGFRASSISREGWKRSGASFRVIDKFIVERAPWKLAKDPAPVGSERCWTRRSTRRRRRCAL